MDLKTWLAFLCSVNLDITELSYHMLTHENARQENTVRGPGYFCKISSQILSMPNLTKCSFKSFMGGGAGHTFYIIN